MIGRKATPPTVALRDGLACHFADGDVTLVLGGASSELLGGSALGTALSDAANTLQRTAVALAAGAGPVPPLGLHTSIGTLPCLERFVRALEAHLPASWRSETSDWGGWATLHWLPNR